MVLLGLPMRFQQMFFFGSDLDTLEYLDFLLIRVWIAREWVYLNKNNIPEFAFHSILCSYNLYKGCHPYVDIHRVGLVYYQSHM